MSDRLQQEPRLSDRSSRHASDTRPGVGYSRKGSARPCGRSYRVGGKPPAVEEFRFSRSRVVKSGGREYRNTEQYTIGFPDRFRHDSAWDNDKWSYVSVRNGGWFEDLGNYRPMQPIQVQAFHRRFHSHPLVLLANRKHKDFVAEALPPITIDGERFDRVKVWLSGTTATLLIDKAGDIRSTSVRDRGRTLAFVNVERRYAEFVTAGGLRLPTTEQVFNDGKPIDGGPVRWKLTVNPKNSDSQFQRPPQKQ